jgi:hypothetical protein
MGPPSFETLPSAKGPREGNPTHSHSLKAEAKHIVCCMFRPLLVSVAVLAVALAGCSSSPSEPAPVIPGGHTATEKTGVIQGVVVDAGIRPLAGVEIIATGLGETKNTTTNEEGAFGFGDLKPGTWFLSAYKFGYDRAQQSTEVVAAKSNPPVVKILLQDNPAAKPYSETFPWAGFIQCSVGIPETGSVNPCFVSPDSKNVYRQNLSKVPTFVQAEMVWRPATAVGTSFLLSSFVPGAVLADDFAEVEGGSPLILRIEGDLLANKSVGETHPLAFRVFPGQDQPTVFANQAFTVYITLFYGYKPPPEWSFVEDGALDPSEPS